VIEPGDARDLLVLLSGLPDPRPTGGRVHPLGYVLAVTLVAFTCPAFAHLVGAAAWAGGVSQQVLRMLGARADPLSGAVSPPSEATIRRVINGVDPQALAAAFTHWLAARTGEQAGEQMEDGQVRDQVRGVAVDGKAMRGARGYDGTQNGIPYLLGAATHDQAIVLGQVQVPTKTSEIASVPVLLDQLNAAGHLDDTTVITVDALHTIRETATAIRKSGAHYVMTVKANTPKLRHAITTYLGEADVVVRRDDSSSRGHGRTEQRIVTAAALPQVGHVGVDRGDVDPGDGGDGDEGVDFPDAAQVMRIVRYRGGLNGQRTSKEVVHAITSLPEDKADVACLARLIRGHWSIENGVHHVRDVTFGEDAHRARTGHAPLVLATLRNIITAAIRLTGATNIAAARRTATSDIHTAIGWFTAPTEPDESSL
jgi:predicted transposase YbfD/YdcC